jgi:DNA-binding GntR family transcriptional regulator
MKIQGKIHKTVNSFEKQKGDRMSKDELPSSSSNGINEASQLEGIAVVHARLRTLILDGVFPPGSMLSQVKLAEMLEVGRLPLREALRMLQNEGLVEAEHNQRARIPAFDPQVLDALYATRLPLEAVGISLTVMQLQRGDLEVLEQTLDGMDEAGERNDGPAMADLHRKYHRLLVQHAGTQLCSTIAGYADRSEYYRRMGFRQIYESDPVKLRETAGAEHRAIYEACRERNPDEAARRLVLHFARTALSLLALMAPQYQPSAIRTALHVVGADSSPYEIIVPGKRTRKKASL